MILKRFYDDNLAQASYLVGCAATGEAVVIDPNRDVQQYIDAAADEDLSITHVTETHIHADFVSGLNELVSQTGARAYVSDEGGADWRYRFASDIGAVLLHDGDSFNVGNIRLQVLHTPGHTPEHVCFIVTDTAGADEPMGVFTGDFLFVGDVGRPDLLERAAGVSGTMEVGARQLFASLERIRSMPEWLQVWPGHGAGSACGKSLGAVPSTTLGYETRFNWAFSITDENEFVASVLAGQPEPPRYFAEMKRINRDGPRVLGGMPRPSQLSADALGRAVDRGEVLVDARPWPKYRAGHVPGALSIPLNRSFTTWAGWLLPYDRDVYVIVDAGESAPAAVNAAARDLAMIGLDRVAGYFTSDVLDRFTGSLHTIDELTAGEVRARYDRGEVAILDVRGADEYASGHIAGATHIPLGYLRDRIDEVPAGKPLVVHCASGVRSAIATSVLEAAGIADVVNLAGGMKQWRAAGNPVEAGEAAATR